MPDRATPNLPSSDFDATESFYASLGFERASRDPGWMVLERGRLTLEFFPFPGLKPATSNFACCLRLDDLEGFYAVCLEAGIEEKTEGFPRLHPPGDKKLMAALIDPDGTLLRLIRN